MEQYEIGAIAQTHQPKELAEKMTSVLFDSENNKLWKKNLPQAAKELCWENEEKILQEIYRPFV